MGLSKKLSSIISSLATGAIKWSGIVIGAWALFLLFFVCLWLAIAAASGVFKDPTTITALVANLTDAPLTVRKISFGEHSTSFELEIPVGARYELQRRMTFPLDTDARSVGIETSDGSLYRCEIAAREPITDCLLKVVLRKNAVSNCGCGRWSGES